MGTICLPCMSLLEIWPPVPKHTTVSISQWLGCLGLFGLTGLSPSTTVLGSDWCDPALRIQEPHPQTHIHMRKTNDDPSKPATQRVRVHHVRKHQITCLLVSIYIFILNISVHVNQSIFPSSTDYTTATAQPVQDAPLLSPTSLKIADERPYGRWQREIHLHLVAKGSCCS